METWNYTKKWRAPVSKCAGNVRLSSYTWITAKDNCLKQRLKHSTFGFYPPHILMLQAEYPVARESILVGMWARGGGGAWGRMLLEGEPQKMGQVWREWKQFRVCPQTACSFNGSSQIVHTHCRRYVAHATRGGSCFITSTHVEMAPAEAGREQAQWRHFRNWAPLVPT